MIKLSIDGREVEADPGAPLVEVIKKAGFFIPNLCYIDGLPPYAGCRTCAVEVEGMRGVQTSCTLKTQAGMVVHTNTPPVIHARMSAQGMIQADHPDRCLTCHRRIKCGWGDICLRDDVVNYRCVTCAKNKRCELLSTSEGLHMALQERYYFEARSWYSTPQPPTDRANPFMEYDPHICILCTRCLRACDEIRFTTAIGLAHRGPQLFITFGQGGPIQESDCDFNGACVDVCPTGALMEHPNKWAGLPERWVESACPDCSTGCRLHVGLKNGRIIQIKPLPCAGPTQDQICARGRYGYDILSKVRRIEAPQVRRGEAQAPVAWDEALDAAALALAAVVSKSGPDAVAVLGSSRATNEESYLLQKLARAAIGTNNVDHVSSAYYRPVVEAMRASLGVAATPGNLEDLSQASCILVVGGDISATNPVANLWVKQAAGEKGKRIPLVFISPRAYDLKRFAQVWLQPSPGTESVLLNALAAATIDRAPAAATSLPGFADLKAQLQGQDLARAAEKAGVAVEEIQRAADLLAQGAAAEGGSGVQFVLGPQVAPPATGRATAASFFNLALLLRAGRESSGIIALSPEANGQGAVDMGLAPDTLPGQMDLTQAPRFKSAWGVELPSTSGLDTNGIIRATAAGRVKGLVLHADDALLELPDRSEIEAALRRLEALVIVGSLDTDLSRLAHVLLPGQAAYEKDGTITSAERQVQRQRQAVASPGDSKPDWWIIAELGRRLGERVGRAVNAPVPYEGPAAIMDEVGRLAPQYAAVSHAALDCERIRWQPEVKAQLAPPPVLDSVADSQYRYKLLTGRPLFTSFEAVATHTTEADLLHREEQLDISPTDAELLDVMTGDRVTVESPRGLISIAVRLIDGVPPGVVHVSRYWRGGAVNRLLALTGPEAEGDWWRVRLSKEA